MTRTTMFDDVANDLALWIDETASKVALALAPRQAPFAVSLTEEQKLEIYTRQLFNPDGTPNTAGRAKELARLGAEGFAQVYKAVVAAHPELRPRAPEGGEDSIDALAPMPQQPMLPPGGPMPPEPMPPMPNGMPMGMPPQPPMPGGMPV